MGENNKRARARIRRENVVDKIRNALGGDQEDILSTEKFGGYRTQVNEIIEERETLALRINVKEEKHLEVYGELREDIGMKTYLHGPMDYAKKLKLRFRVGDLDLPETNK